MAPALTYSVAVESHDRIDTANKKTLRLLADRGVPHDAVHVFVDPPELDAYKAGLDRFLYGQLLPGGPDLCAQRNAAFDYFPEGHHVISFDDDLADVVQWVNEKETVPVDDLPALFARAHDACVASGATLWGIYPVLNAMFMRPGISTELAFCIGHLFGFINTREPWCRFTLPNKTDYEQTLLRYDHDGAVVRLNDIAAKTKMLAPGGFASRLPDEQRQTANRISVQQLAARWPQHVRITKRRMRGQGLQIRLVHQEHDSAV